ncbi:MAG: hypothetical protein AAFZ15_04625 [Bacteroidota bacterium]
MKSMDASLVLPNSKIFFLIIQFCFLPALFFAQNQFSKTHWKTIENKDNLKKAFFEIESYDSEKEKKHSFKRTDYYSKTGKEDSTFFISKSYAYKKYYDYDSLLTIKTIHYRKIGEAPNGYDSTVYKLSGQNPIYSRFTYSNGSNNEMKYIYSAGRPIKVYKVQDKKINSIQRITHFNDSLKAFILHHSFKKKSPKEKKMFDDVFLDKLTYDTVHKYVYHSIEDTLIYDHYKYGKLYMSVKDYQGGDKTILEQKIFSDKNTCTHYIMESTDTSFKKTTIHFYKTNTSFAPVEKLTAIHTTDKEKKISKTFGKKTQESKEEILFKYKYDDRGNWIEKIARQDQKVIYKELRTFEYYP